jgi:hypothetical protein
MFLNEYSNILCDFQVSNLKKIHTGIFINNANQGLKKV